MAPKIKRDQIITQGHSRIFRQPGGPGPSKARRYSGLTDQYLNLTGVAAPVRGGITPIRVSDPYNPKSYINVGRSEEPPDYASATLEVLERHGTLPFPLSSLKCLMNLYVVTGACADPTDFLGGWSDKIEIYEYAEASDVDLGDRTGWDSDEQVMDSISLTIEQIYAVSTVFFGQIANAEISREVVDVVYGRTYDCIDCGEETSRIYAVTKSSGSGSPGLPAEVIYSLDGGSNLLQVNIDGFGATEDPLAIDIVGNYLVVLGSGAYFYAELNRVTGVPGAFTKVISGFVSGKAPQDIYVASPSEVWFVGSGGYIYKSTDIPSGVSVIDAGSATSNNLTRIKGAGDTLVAVGESTTILVSQNRGTTWATTISNPIGAAVTLSAVEVIDERLWWVGSRNSGRLFYTETGGETWGQTTFVGNGAGNVQDILFATDTVGWFVHDNGSTASLFATFDGGFSWTKISSTSRRAQNWTTFMRANRLAIPTGHASIQSNYLAVAGPSAGGVDGVLLVGAGNIV